MKIVNKRKFIRTISIIIIIIGIAIIFSTNTYSKVEVTYKENYIYSGDTLWSIAEQEAQDNKYFENKDIREIVNELKNINDLLDSNLYEGAKIKIPVYE